MSSRTLSGLWPKLAKLRWLPVRHWYDLRALMRLPVMVRDRVDGVTYRFRPESFEAYQRARQIISKEPQTIEWLRKNLRPDDVFVDIGANVGTFSIFAGRHVSDAGHVYACEPHLPTTVQLLRNVASNRLENRVSVLSLAVSGGDGFIPFHYKRWGEGASGSQLQVEGAPAMKERVGVELKCGMSVDSMIARGIIRAPNLVKIDTDGIEIAIVSGMLDLLRGPQRPRSILLEIQRGEYDHQVGVMRTCGYEMTASHPVGKWARMIARGHELNEVDFNAVFEPVQNAQ